MVTAAQIQKQFGLGDSSSGLIVVDSADALSTPSLKGQAHYIRRAFDRLNLDAVVCDAKVPCEFIWFQQFGFVTLPFMAFTAFVGTIVLVTLPPLEKR